jgi:hypothetical protein
MNIHTLNIKGITFLDIRSISDKELNRLCKLKFGNAVSTDKGTFAKVEGWKIKSETAGLALHCVFVEWNEMKKYYLLDGLIE